MSLAERWDDFWFAETSLVRLAWWRILVLALAALDLVAYAHTALADAAAIDAGTQMKTWTPIYVLEALGVEPLGLAPMRCVIAVAIVALAAGWVGWRTRTACAVAAICCLFVTAHVYSFGKVHHDKVSFAFAISSLALGPCGARLSIDAWLARRRGEGESERASGAALPLRLTQLSLALGYAFAGWTKLAVSGVEWANGYTLMRYLMQYDNAWSRFLCSHVALTAALSWGALVVQGTFPLVFVFPALRWFYLPGAVAFHVITWFAMDTGPYMTCWLLLASFLPLERVPEWLAAEWRAGSAPRRARVIASLAPAAVVALVAWVSLPTWAFVAVAAFGAWALRPLLALSRAAM
ncbi:MAG: HTTM domain-containing protein [Planctomycetes bacterium]|nr:HTTM domain-containing protein [Planctomycetota bacterium]